MYTHGTHGQTGPWKYLDFPNNADIKATFYLKPLEYIRIRIKDERELRKASKHSQSTVSFRDDGESLYAVLASQLRLTIRIGEGFIVNEWRSAAQVMGNRTETMS